MPVSRRDRTFDDGAAASLATYDGARRERVGFFTDTTLCIGCKACEVACKEWNEIPEDGYAFTAQSYDNTGALGGNTWRHVAFVEQFATPQGAAAPTLPRLDEPSPQSDDILARLHATASSGAPDARGGGPTLRLDDAGRWLMSSDVCKHCTRAACLDVCPTGALFRSEFGTVVVQDDVCNGCGYCIPACPFGVIDEQPQSGHAAKCTLCYNRLRDGETPACAKACPTESIVFGPLDELRARADARLAAVTPRFPGAQLYGHDRADGVGGFGAFFLLLDRPEVYGLPPDPVVTTRDLPELWRSAAVAAGVLAGLTFAAALGASSP